MGSILLALNISISGYAYMLFTISCMLWIEVGVKLHNKNIVLMNSAFLAINAVGIIRWLVK